MAAADPSITNNRLLENYPQKSQITDGADWETSERLQLAGKKAKRKILFFFPLLYKVSKHSKYSRNRVRSVCFHAAVSVFRAAAHLTANV